MDTSSYSTSELKRCKACGEMFPRTAEYYYRMKNAPDGLGYSCKPCSNKQHAKYVEDHKGEMNRKQRENRYKYAERNKAYEQARKPKKSIIRQKWREAHRERDQETMRRFYASHPGYSREWEKSRPEEEVKRQRIRSAAKRRARERKLAVDFTEQDWEQTLQHFGGRCAVCGRSAGLWHMIAQEHWIPIADKRPDNPGTVAWNIIPMCHSLKGSNRIGSCNLSKQNKDPLEWLIGYLGKRKGRAKYNEITSYLASRKR